MKGQKLLAYLADARMSGEMISKLCRATLPVLVLLLWIGIKATHNPTVEMAVTCIKGSQRGIILAASHNPKQWNAL